MFCITPHPEIRNICVEFIFRADSVLGFVSIQVLLLHTRLVLPRVVSMTIVPLVAKCLIMLKTKVGLLYHSSQSFFIFVLHADKCQTSMLRCRTKVTKTQLSMKTEYILYITTVFH